MLQSDTACMNQPQNGDESRWQRTHFANLVRYKSSKTYFARIRIDGKLIRRTPTSPRAPSPSCERGAERNNCRCLHDLLRGNPPADEFHQPFHSRLPMLQKVFEPGTEVVQSWFSVGGFAETVFGAAATADEKEIALPAISGKSGLF